MLAINHPVEDFSLPSTDNATFVLSANVGKHLIIYFYPKDDTPGCTLEGQDFRDHLPEFTKENCIVVGVSRDNLKSHQCFKEKMQFPFELLSDENEKVCNLFGVMKMKNMYGKQVLGIERSTFVIDAQGILRKGWRGVKVPGHVQEVLDFVTTLNQ